MPADRHVDRLQTIVVHQAARFGEHVGQTPQRCGPPHSQRGLPYVVGLERNPATVCGAHIVKQKVGVRVERNIAERWDYSGLSAVRGPQRHICLCRKTLDMANIAPDSFKHGVAGRSLVRRWLGWNGS